MHPSTLNHRAFLDTLSDKQLGVADWFKPVLGHHWPVWGKFTLRYIGHLWKEWTQANNKEEMNAGWRHRVNIHLHSLHLIIILGELENCIDFYRNCMNPVNNLRRMIIFIKFILLIQEWGIYLYSSGHCLLLIKVYTILHMHFLARLLPGTIALLICGFNFSYLQSMSVQNSKWKIPEINNL